MQKGKLDEKRDTDQVGSKFIDQSDGGGGGPSRGEEVIDQ
jgi:hypothetical protein